MSHISIISSSVRTDRKSHRVALYLKTYLHETNLATSEILDLKEYNFPIFNERLSKNENPSERVLEFAQKIKSSDGIIVVTPEYNGGYPASLKNIIDLLYDEWKRKPVSFATVSSTAFGGSQVIIQIQSLLWKIGAWTVPLPFFVSKVQEMFDEFGNANDKMETNSQASAFIKELLWCMDAKNNALSIEKNLLII
jgi:NAD(P)H-dependent FMN reductase